MGQVCRIGLDIAKLNFQVHGVDAFGRDVFNKKLLRHQVLNFFANLPACVVGLEACGGAHYWAREIAKLDTGHAVHLISPRQIRPFVLNNKTDAADARAICEVVGRPSTRFVAPKTIEQQDMGAWHRIRERTVRARTALVNQIRGLLHEHGIIIPQGISHARRQLPVLVEDLDNRLSMVARDYLSELYTELVDLDARIEKYEQRLFGLSRQNEICKRLLQIPGIGPLTASAMVAHAGDGRQYKNGREFAASLGLTPHEHSSGGKQKLLGISKRGNGYLRKLLIQGARIVTRHSLIREAPPEDYRTRWLQELAGRRGKMVAAVAQANKTARIAWNVLRGSEYANYPVAPA